MSQDTERDLSQLYRAGADEAPSPRLVRDIEHAARRELRGSRLRTFLEMLPRWRVALGAMAVVTLSVSLVMTMKDDVPVAGEPALPKPARRESSASEAVGQPTSPARSSASSERPRAPAPGAAKPSEPIADLERKREDRVARGGTQDQVELDSAKKQDSADIPRPAEAREPAAQTRPPPAAPPAAVEPSRTARSLDMRQRSNAEPATAAGRSVAKETAATSADESPESWIKRLQDLLRQGREQEARVGLERFRQRYPEFALPDNLKALVKEAPAEKGTGETRSTQ